MRVLALALLGALLIPASAAEARQVPPGFLGVMVDGPMFDSPAVNSERELQLAARTGVESIRAAVYWDIAQPYAPGTPAPPGYVSVDGVPTSFARFDAVVDAASRAGLRVLPVVIRSPAWARAAPTDKWSPPRRDAYARYASFLHALVLRYPQIRDWQVWNEPNAPWFWTIQPGIADYAALLRASATAIRTANPRARVILAGLSGRSWPALAELYRLGARRNFDAVALNPFTSRVTDVIRILERNRRVMASHGDARKPLLVTETTWPSALGRLTTYYGYEETEQGQARRLRHAMLEFARQRHRLRITGVYWYTWMSRDSNTAYPFDWSGLRRFNGSRVTSKPALGALRRVARILER
jgi:hypothetical protein